MSGWPERCTLMGCQRPTLRPHHHHFYRGHLMIEPCQCGRGGQPGASAPNPKETP